jgi:hypothetical protein
MLWFMRVKDKVDISGLKEWANINLGPDSKLRIVLNVERDQLEVEEFLAKMETWMKVSRLESKEYR